MCMHRRRRLLVGLFCAALLLPACTGDHIGDSSADAPDPFPRIEAAPPHLPRLTQKQYANALRDIFGPKLVVPARLEPDVSIDGLIAVGTSQTSVSARGTEQYESAAYDIAAQAMQPGVIRDAVVACSPQTVVDPACARETLAALGLRLWRRPLVEAELDRLVQVVGEAAITLGDFHEGLGYGLAGLLQSPNFLFRSELGEDDGAGGRRYTSYELAARLSFFLWNSTPDAELLDLAKTGEILRDDVLEAEVARMLADARARAAVRNFFSEAYDLQELDHLSKDTIEFVHMNAEVGPSAREETLMTIEDLIFDERADFRKIFTSRKTFLNRQLAAIYDVRAPSREGFAAFYWPEASERGGLLTQISILAGNSHPIDSSATLRGKFVRKKLMCGAISPPPVDVDAALPEPSDQAKTLRERLGAHLANPSCAGCHAAMDPIGLSLENFDALGQYRATERGEPIDASGELNGVVFDGPRGLGEALANAREISDCLTRSMYRYATNHVETQDERVLVRNLQDRMRQQGYKVLTLMRDIVMSPGFRYTRLATNKSASGEMP